MESLKEVDWSKAPDGATHYNAECECPWLKETPLSYFNGDRWIVYSTLFNDNAIKHLKDAVKRPQEWSGEGVPPVGTVCEYRVNQDEWVSGEVFGHRACSNGDVEVFVNLKNSWDYSSSLVRFRPIKTPEQIAAEERGEAIEEMFEISSGFRVFLNIIESLYDAGYRKTEVKK